MSRTVSAIQLRQKDFVDSVLDAVGLFGREPPLLDVEITESVLVDDIEETTRKLQTLRRAGVEISVDDFGTGYCSLSYLARLPVDVPSSLRMLRGERVLERMVLPTQYPDAPRE